MRKNPDREAKIKRGEAEIYLPNVETLGNKSIQLILPEIFHLLPITKQPNYDNKLNVVKEPSMTFTGKVPENTH